MSPTETDAAATAAPAAPASPEQLAAEAKAKAVAEAKALSDALLARIPTIATELDALKSRLIQAATMVATVPAFHSYAEAFVTDVRNKTAEIHKWIDRHLAP